MRISAVNFVSMLTAFSLALFSSALFAQFTDYSFSNKQLILDAGDHQVQIRFLNAQVLQVHYLDAEETPLASFSLASPDVSHGEVVLRKKSHILEFDSGALTARVDMKSGQLAYFWRDSPLIAETENSYFSTDEKRGFHFSLSPEEKLFGTGQRVLGMDRRGWRLPLDNRSHYGYGKYSEQMYFSIPAVMSSKKYLLLFDNPAKGFVDIGKARKDTLSFESRGGRAAYLVMAADSYPELIQQYTDATGKQPLPPRWVFGNYASRFGYRNQQEVNEVVGLFKKHDIPLDALVLDLYWFGPDIKGHMGNLEWDHNAFPEPKKMIKGLSEQGVETILITEPFILSSSSRWKEAVAQDVLAKDSNGGPKIFDFYFGSGGLIDIFDPQARNWFWEIYEQLLQSGVSGLWGDLGEPEAHPDDSQHTLGRGDLLHNAYGHEWARLLYQQHLKRYPKHRPMIMMRSGFAGSQRYGMIPWTGDVSRSWDGLAAQVELTLQMGLLGLGYTHSDLGGFAGGEKFDPELYLRWLQLGVFQAIFRPHAQEHIAPEPVFHDADTIARARKLIQLRYRLLPYLYSLAWENSQTGLPMARPLFFADDNNEALMDNRDSFLWGDSFLISPVSRPDVSEWPVMLPAGNWYDFWDDTHYRGGQVQQVSTLDERFPVLVKGGSFIPMLTDNINNTREYSTRNLSLHYYLDADVKQSEYTLYDDDGKSPSAFEKQRYELSTAKAWHNQGDLRFEFQRKGFAYDKRPDVRSLSLIVHNWPKNIKKIVVNGQTVTADNYHYDTSKQLLTLDVDWAHEKLDVQIQ